MSRLGALAAVVLLAAPAAAEPLPGSSAARLAAVAAELPVEVPAAPAGLPPWTDFAAGQPPLRLDRGALVATVEPRAGAAPRLVVTHGGRRLLDAPVRVPAGPVAGFGLVIVRLDPGTATPEVVVGVAAGGDCCRALTVATAHNDGAGYDTVPGPPRDALGPYRLADLDRDGRHEVIAAERLDLAAAACRPCGATVPAVFGLAATTWVNRSGEGGFAALFAEAARARLAAPGAPADGRDAAAEAAFVLEVGALMARLGRLPEAWAAFRRHDLADRPTRRAIAELLRERRFVDAATPLEPRR